MESRRSRIGGLFFRWLKQHGLADAFTLTTSEGSGESQRLMTRDEWRMRGIDIALSAQGSSEFALSNRLLGQAAQCFERAAEATLRATVSTQMALHTATAHQNITMINTIKESSVVERHSNALSAAEEIAVADTVLRGLRAGLHSASLYLCRTVESRLDAQSKKFFASEVLFHK